MKLLKKLFLGLVFLFMALCAGILICAMIPGLTGKVATLLYGDKQKDGTSEEVPGYPEHIVFDTTVPGIAWDSMPFQNYQAYIILGNEEIQMPTEMLGKAGWSGIDSQVITREEADNEGSVLGVGNLGNELEINYLYFPYYAMLTEDMQSLYRQMYANAESLTERFSPVVEVNAGQLQTVFEALIGDHPELFWLDTGYSCVTVNQQVVEINLKFFKIINRLDAAKREFEVAAEVILDGASGLETDREKESYVHDALLEKITYIMEASMNQSAYSALVNGESVCAGYARAFQYLMQRLGIPCYYCTGYSGENHAWNIILIDGMYRNVDVTWDDTPEGTREYFNQSDKAFAGTHARKGLSVYLPACLEEGVTQEEPSPLEGIAGLINPNPIRPITLDNPGSIYPENSTLGDVDGFSDEQGLREAGIKEADVYRNLESYYRDCEAQLVKAGTGQVQFSNCIPASLWETIEGAYTSGSYKKGYADSACTSLGVKNFAVNLQAVRLSGGYYRLYHTIATW